MRILIISGFLEANIKVGTSKGTTKGFSMSAMNIIKSLRDINSFQIKVISQKFRNKLLIPIGIDSYVLIPRIIKNIIKFKPNLIITESRAVFPSVLISKIKKIPVIAIVRSPSYFCPKYINIINYGEPCSGINNRKECFRCINEWRTLRILIGNRLRDSDQSIRTIFSSILYKIRYFINIFNIYLMNKSNIILFASKIMKEFFSYKINQDRMKVINITPIRRNKTGVVDKKRQLIFIRTYYDASHKGLDFILRLSKLIPKDYHIFIVGGSKDVWKGEKFDNITNLDFISSKTILNKMFVESMITLVPTFFTEAFGRIIIESLTNKTPVISSPQCGANQFFENKDFLKVVPLKLNLWIKTIEDMIQNPPIITDNDVSLMYDKFSLEKSKKDFIKIIKEVLVNGK